MSPKLLDVSFLVDAEGKGEAALCVLSLLTRDACLVPGLPVGRVQMDKLPAPLLWTVKAKYLAAFGGGVEPEEGMVRVSKSPATHGIVKVAINKLTRGTKGRPRDCKQCCSVNQMDTFWKLEIPAKRIRA